MGKKKRRKKLRKLLKKRGLNKRSLAVIICVGKKCCDRARSREVLRAARDHADGTEVHVVRAGCLDVCKKGPIVATYPEAKLFKRVDPAEAHDLVDRAGG